jgi:hypothetical protein
MIMGDRGTKSTTIREQLRFTARKKVVKDDPFNSQI